MKIVNLLMLILTLSLSCLSYGEDLNLISGRTFEVQMELKKAGRSFRSGITRDNLLKIEDLKITKGHFSKFKQGDFDGLDNLRSLNLYGNNLKSISKTIFNNLLKLEALDLSDNQLTELSKEMFYYLPQLQYLNLSGNQLTILPERVFENLSKLKALDLNDNQLTELSKEMFASNETFEGLKNLEELSLNNNKLTKLPHDMFDNLPRLRELDLSNNKMILSKEMLSSFFRLEYLSVSDNQLAKLSKKDINDLKNNIENMNIFPSKNQSSCKGSFDILTLNFRTK